MRNLQRNRTYKQEIFDLRIFKLRSSSFLEISAEILDLDIGVFALSPPLKVSK